MTDYSVTTLKTPKGFYAAFKDTWKTRCNPPWEANSELRDTKWTNWFEDCMATIAEQANPKLHCQNRKGNREEWLKVDHLFLQQNAYDYFPVIAVEHENGALGSPHDKLANPEGRAAIEWALWKVLSVRSHLAVLVAYPGETRKARAIEVTEQMLRAWQEEYSPNTKVLVLIGPAKVEQTQIGDFYKPLEWDAPALRFSERLT